MAKQPPTRPAPKPTPKPALKPAPPAVVPPAPAPLAGPTSATVAMKNARGRTDANGALVVAGGAAAAAPIGPLAALQNLQVRVDATGALVVAGAGGGGGGSLPTAPIGQVLISQGVGTDPIFSMNVDVQGSMSTLGTISAGAYFHCQHPWFIRMIGGPFASRNSQADGHVGNLMNFSDSTVNTPGGTVVGGGTFSVLARWNGTNWIVIGG